MTTKDEALKQALDALHNYKKPLSSRTTLDELMADKAIQACRAALAEQDSEPVAWGNFKEDGTLVGLSQHPEDQANWNGRKPLYTTPQPAPAVPQGWKLVPVEPTERQKMKGAMQLLGCTFSELEDYKQLDGYLSDVQDVYNAAISSAPQAPAVQPLTDEQIDRITIEQWGDEGDGVIFQAHRSYARAIEAAHGIGAPKEDV